MVPSQGKMNYPYEVKVLIPKSDEEIGTNSRQNDGSLVAFRIQSFLKSDLPQSPRWNAASKPQKDILENAQRRMIKKIREFEKAFNQHGYERT